MFITRQYLSTSALVATLVLGPLALTPTSHAQERSEHHYLPDIPRALASRKEESASVARQNGYTPLRSKSDLEVRSQTFSDENGTMSRHPARVVTHIAPAQYDIAASALTRIRPGTPLSRVLHTAQLSITSSAGTDEQYVDRTGDLVADERTTFDTGSGSFDVAVGRSGTRYEVYSAIDDKGTANTNDDMPIGVLVVALDTNSDYVRDSSSTYNLKRDFNLPSAVAVVTGTSNAGREFVIVSSSGYYNSKNPNDPNNEPTAGVVLLVRDPLTGGFDNARSRELVRVGDQQLNNANALALLPNNDLLIADFDSDELRIVRDTDKDGVPDTLDAKPYYSYRYSDDAPIAIAANSRGVVFSHSFGNNAVLLALYDTDGDGRADHEEVVAEGLSLDNNLILHGLTVDREGTVYVIEDATGAADSTADGGNGGKPLIDAFPDPALNGFLHDGALYAVADNPNTQALSGLSFGVDTVLGAVRHLTLVNSASLRAPATYDGLASVLGQGLTQGRRGASESDAATRSVRVTVEGRSVPVLSFSESQINLSIPKETGAGVRSVVVTVDGNVIAADDVTVASTNPGLFTVSQTGAGEAIALLVTGMRYTACPCSAKTDGQPSVVTLFGTGWRNSLPVTVRIGGQAAAVQYAGPSGGFPGLDQIDVRLPESVSGMVPIVVTTANSTISRNDVILNLR